MATVIEPKTEQETQPQPVSQVASEPDLFATELAMENRSHNFLPLLLAAALVLVVGGTIYYFVKSSHEVLSVSAATTTINDIMRGQGPAVTRFSTGTVEPDNGLQDPQYKLLSRTGVVMTKAKGTAALIVALTGPGDNLLSNIDGVAKVKKSEDRTTYSVPLAERKLVSIDKITLLKPHLAKVDYTWKWVPNRLGQEFDASGSLVKSFSSWERATLIKSYGVDFYSAAPTKTSIVLMEGDDGTWKPYVE
ncbi:MAG: hypothetical protein ABSD98_12815 [Candidatus Korobacteraceae bacterium]|jgi:hypothetical protein